MHSICTTLLFAFAFLSSCSPALVNGRESGQKDGKSATYLSPEMEREVRAKYDSLMAIYDPWKELISGWEHKNALKEHGLTKSDIMEKLVQLDKEYPRSSIGDLILMQITIISTNKSFNLEGDKSKYDANYRESLHYVMRLANEYPKSPYSEKMLFGVGARYAGTPVAEVWSGKYAKPYIEFVKRYPNNKCITVALFMITNSSEDTVYEFKTKCWAYNLWRKKYNDLLFFLDFIQEPECELTQMYEKALKGPKYKERLKKAKEEYEKEKKDIGKGITRTFENNLEHSLSLYWDDFGKFPKISTGNKDKIIKFFLPYNPGISILHCPEVKVSLKSDSTMFFYTIKYFEFKVKDSGYRKVEKRK